MLLEDMVLQKRIDYGFNGYQVPVIPRALRSARRRRSFGKKVEDSQMYAFELLATVAGELLLEKESSAPSNVSAGRVQFPIGRDSIKQEEHDEKKQFKQETCDQGSCDESASVFTLGSQRHGCDYAYKEYSHVEEDSTRRLASVVTKSETPENISCAAESVIGESKKEHGNFPCTTHEKFHVERGSPGCAESYDGKMEDEIKRQRQVEQKRTGSMRSRAVSEMFNLEDPMETDIKPSALVSSDSSVEVHMYGSHNPCSLFTRCRDDAKLVSRDDDENSSGCTQRSTSTLKSCRSPHFGDRKIRKLMASKYWKEAPSMLKLVEQTNSELETSPVSRIRRTCYTRQRTQRCSFKRRKLYERISVSTPDRSVSGEVSNSPEKGISGEETCQGATIHWASRSSSSMVGHRSSLEPRDSHVKLKIKSFRVPELFIEIPETATIGSLKRTVMEAVTAVLGGGLRVGVLLQGKKLRDDNETLLQTGISHDDSLGFTLEPTTPVNPPAPRCPEDSQCMLPCDTNQQKSRYRPVPASDLGMSEAAPETPGLSIIGSSNHVEGDHDSVHFHPNVSMEKAMPDSKALVAIPAMNAEALAVVPLDKKSKRTDLVQRRIRRPFSVSEVEALVQAVEKLGTGRWRDVKLRAFENAKHRTYVDLKDKWKTLVHTARISPQQRRGEPVPQELLDRVLSAHSYWSEHPSKQHIKHQHPEPCLLH